MVRHRPVRPVTRLANWGGAFPLFMDLDQGRIQKGSSGGGGGGGGAHTLVGGGHSDFGSIC